jgi:hypothetical protein
VEIRIRTTAKHVCIGNVSRQLKYVPTIIYLLEGGYSIRTGYKRYQNCHSSLEYEFDTGDVSTRLSFDEIRERLSDISDDILVYAVDMLIRPKARFNLGSAILKLIGNMYIMVPVTAKLIPLSTDRSETEKIVDLVSGKAMERR